MTTKFCRRMVITNLLLAVFVLFGWQGSAEAQQASPGPAKEEPRIPLNLKTVLVFDLSALDTLDTIGVKVAGVPQGVKPKRLEKYNSAEYPKIGSLFEPDYEAVSAMKPDIIIVGGRSSAKYAELAKIAPTIDLTVDPQHYIASAKANAETLGRLFRKEDEVAKHLKELDASIAALHEKAQTVGKGLVILTTGGRMSAFGPGSRFGVLYEDFGIVPAVPDLKVANHGQSISYEFILKTNPDWLFVIDRDAVVGKQGQSAKEMLNNALVNKTTAWKEGHVVYLDPADWYLAGSGLSALKAAVRQVREAIGG